MKKLFLFICALVLVCGSQAQTLKFGKDKKFTILQLTDTHLDPSKPCRLAEAVKTFTRINKIIDMERPDWIILTGDVVTGAPADQMWQRVLDTLDHRGIPYSIVLGNHEAEQDLTRQEIGRLVISGKHCLNVLNDKGEIADQELVVESSDSHRPALALYCMDSHDDSQMENIDGYGWFSVDQVNWFREAVNARTASVGGKPIPGLAFFHIVLHEYVDAWRNPENTRIGRRGEDECPGALNTGMFAAMVETGSVMGSFVGHDHDIDYLVAEKGICLGYGRYSGDNTTYNNLRQGARVIVLEEGVRGFESWIREGDGRMVDHVIFSEGKLKEIFVER